MDTDAVIAMRTKGEGLVNDGQFWTEEHKQLLYTYFSEGLGITESAIRLGRSEPAIVQQLVKDGVFAYETGTRNPRKQKGRCLCCKCGQSQVCKFSQKNRDDSIYATKGASANHV
jgi:hypothetical protein